MIRIIKTFRNEDRKIEIRDFLQNHFIASLASQGTDIPEIAIVFYVFNGDAIYFKSRTTSSHSKNISNFNSVSLSIYSHESNYETKYGVQINGIASIIKNTNIMKDAVDLYCAKFKGASDKLPTIDDLCSKAIQSTFYQIKVTKFKIIDEDKSTNNTMLNFENF